MSWLKIKLILFKRFTSSLTFFTKQTFEQLNSLTVQFVFDRLDCLLWLESPFFPQLFHSIFKR